MHLLHLEISVLATELSRSEQLLTIGLYCRVDEGALKLLQCTHAKLAGLQKASTLTGLFNFRWRAIIHPKLPITVKFRSPTTNHRQEGKCRRRGRNLPSSPARVCTRPRPVSGCLLLWARRGHTSPRSVQKPRPRGASPFCPADNDSEQPLMHSNLLQGRAARIRRLGHTRNGTIFSGLMQPVLHP